VAINEKVMKPAERHVFIYIFAALGEEGKIFIHQVMNQLSGYDPDELNAAIKAVPPTTMSCNKVRKNLKHLIEKTGCNCQFRLPDGCYASPVVHAGIFPGTNKTIIKPINQPVAISTKELIAGNSASIDKLMKEYKLLKTQQENLNARLRILKDQINRIFEQSGSEEITTSIGTYCRLVSENESANSGNSSD
jgi:hypothetical protein